MIKYLESESDFKEIIKEGTWIVDFYADWCGPCKMLAPIMDEVSKEVKVFKVNTDDEGELAEEYNIMSIPCVIAFKDGKEINRSVGLVDKDTIINLVK